jgi:hypothetical protein
MKMANSLNEQVIKMYRDGVSNGRIKLALKIKEIEIKEILRRHVDGVRINALEMYEKDSHREGIKERICRDLCIRISDLEEWISFRNFQNKMNAKNLIKREEPKQKIRIQNGFSPWISYIVEKCYLERLWRGRNENNKKMADVR